MTNQTKTADKPHKATQTSKASPIQQDESYAAPVGAAIPIGVMAPINPRSVDANPVESQRSRLKDDRISLVQRQNIAQNIGEFQGNGHLNQMVDQISSIQRDDVPEQNRGTWTRPFEQGTAQTKEQIRVGLSLAILELIRLQQMFEEGEYEQGFTHRIMEMRELVYGQLSGEGHIDRIQAGILNLMTSDLNSFYREKLGILRRRITSGLESFSEVQDTSAQESQLNEQLHNAFIEGSDDQIGEIRAVVDALLAYNSQVQQVLSFSQSIASRIGAAQTASALQRLAGGSTSVATLVGKIQNVLTAAHALATITGIDNQAVGDAQNSINQFEAAMDGIDLAMGFAKAVPIIGQLWSSYYRPLINHIIVLLRQLFRDVDRLRRNQALAEWAMDNEGGGDSAPTIPVHLIRYFPGGQPVLNFMYAVVNFGEGSPTPAVERFFMEHMELFNAGEQGTDLERDGWDWYNPFSWGEERQLTNLATWVQVNANTVWAMLYGDLPHSLSGR